MEGTCSKSVFPLQKYGQSSSTPGSQDLTSLMKAAANGWEEYLRDYIRAGADVNIATKHGETTLHEAAINGQDKCIEVLIKAGADVNASHKGRIALIAGARKGYEKCVDLLIIAGAVVNMYYESCGMTPLSEAARNGHVECMSLLIEAGANVNITYDHNDREESKHMDWTLYEGATALHLSAERGKSKCVQLLLKAGAHVNICNNHGENALLCATRGPTKQGCTETSILLFAAGESLNCLHEDKMPEFLKFIDVKMELKHMCRETINKHLIKLDPHTNLFGRIPQLGLPVLLTKYLLFNMTLNSNE